MARGSQNTPHPGSLLQVNLSLLQDIDGIGSKCVATDPLRIPVSL